MAVPFCNPQASSVSSYCVCLTTIDLVCSVDVTLKDRKWCLTVVLTRLSQRANYAEPLPICLFAVCPSFSLALPCWAISILWASQRGRIIALRSIHNVLRCFLFCYSLKQVMQGRLYLKSNGRCNYENIYPLLQFGF